jgi:hypothetical protein
MTAMWQETNPARLMLDAAKERSSATGFKHIFVILTTHMTCYEASDTGIGYTGVFRTHQYWGKTRTQL